ncbi:MAG: SH3 domain-containing protein, partial [Cyanobacteria bacterium J06648_11]
KEDLMKSRGVLMTAVLATLLGCTSASAATPAVATTNVNLRAGPSTDFPIVRVVPSGARLVTIGCLADYSWCDVRFAGARGWMAARYIFLSGPRTVVTAPIAAPVGIPVVAFSHAYWRAHYTTYPWYGAWPRYAARPAARVRPRPARPFGRRGRLRGCAGAGCSGTRSFTGPGGGTVTRSITVTP